MKQLVIVLLVAAGLWMVMFSPWTAPWVPFWAAMAISSCALATWAVMGDRLAAGAMLRFRWIHIVVGVVSAAGLYGVFFIGHHLTGAVTDHASQQVQRIYLMRESAPLWVIVLLLLLIAPAEELFWRGFVQRRLMGEWGGAKGYLAAAALYAGVHVWALNPMLLAAALLCGLAWGWLFLRCRSLWPSIISHVVWDVAIFVVFPIQ